MTSAFALLFCNQFAAFIAGHEALLYLCDDHPPLTTYIFKCALKKFFKKQQKVPVFFERNFKTSHLQIQTVPIPCDMATCLKDVFQVHQ